MASTDKVLSLFEPPLSHPRGPSPETSGGAEVEFERHLIEDDVDESILTRYETLEQPHEQGQAVEAVQHHRQVFGQAPRLVAGDRGVHSADNEQALTAAGVKLVTVPASGKLSEARQALERSRSFKRGYRWRPGIEGRIASLRRDYGWHRSGYHGPDGRERWLGLGVLASNLRRIALAKHR